MVICRADVDPTRPTDHGSLLHQSGFLYTLVSFMGTLSIISACTHVYVSHTPACVRPTPLTFSTLLHDPDSPLVRDLANWEFLVFIIKYIGYVVVVNNAIISFPFYCVKISTRKPRNK